MYVQACIDNHIREHLSTLSEDIDFNSSTCDINNNLSHFYDCLSNAVDPLFKVKVNRAQSVDANQNHRQAATLPWYDISCKEKQREFYRLLNIYRKNKNDENRRSMVKARSDYKSMVRKKKFIFDTSETRKIEKIRFENAKAYWNLLKTKYFSQSSNVLDADTFAEYFKAINNPASQFYQPDVDVLFFNERYLNGELQVMFEELNIEISNNEILKACNELHCGKAGGPDLVINEFFKHGIEFLIDYLQGTEGYIIPLHKKGDKDKTENYRPITLLSALGKLFTRILNNRLCSWAEKYHIYVEAQAGFRKEMGTIDNVFVINGLINHLLNANKRLFVAFIDFSKAFDYVVKDNLWFKLIRYGVRGKILNILRDMYKSVKSKVLYNSEESEEFECFFGCKTG